tara:strand:+ start:282 stop:428 length:147 start_codon:yes stop_codon:yes gene_type:complete
MIKKIIQSLFLFCTLTSMGCGQKGALILPDNQTPSELSNNLATKNQTS